MAERRDLVAAAQHESEAVGAGERAVLVEGDAEDELLDLLAQLRGVAQLEGEDRLEAVHQPLLLPVPRRA